MTRLAPQKRRTKTLGQSLIVFALMSTVIFGIIGLAVDSGVSYLSAAGSTRAAGAAALAGVVDMPDFAAAKTEALKVAAANGFPDPSKIDIQQDCTLPLGAC